jgi:hypothetical protein
MTTNRTKKTKLQPQALRCFWEEARGAATKTAVLCVEHRSELFFRFSNARGGGEFHPNTNCEKCSSVASFNAFMVENKANGNEAKWTSWAW